MLDPGIKICNICGKRKPLSEFPLAYRSSIDGRDGRCRACKNARFRDRARYGLTKSAYREMLNRTCEICGASGDSNIDHSHTTGKVRGTLCGLHNRGLGLFNDDIELLFKAVEYLLKHEAD